MGKEMGNGKSTVRKPQSHYRFCRDVLILDHGIILGFVVNTAPSRLLFPLFCEQVPNYSKNFPVHIQAGFEPGSSDIGAQWSTTRPPVPSKGVDYNGYSVFLYGNTAPLPAACEIFLRVPMRREGDFLGKLGRWRLSAITNKQGTLIECKLPSLVPPLLPFRRQAR